jgi:hypothetical protein
MTIRLYWTKTMATEAGSSVGPVELFAGDRPDHETPTEWVSARILLDQTNEKSLALIQIAALSKARDLIDDEIQHLESVYDANEQVPR